MSGVAVAATVVSASGALAHGGLPADGSADRLPGGWLAAPRTEEDCPTEVDRGRFATPGALFESNREMAAFGERPTGARNHRRYVDDIEARLARLPGGKLESVPYAIDRWSDRKVGFRARAPGGPAERLPIAGPVPYSKGTAKRGVAAPLVTIDPREPIAAGTAAGKIVVRPLTTTSVPNAAFAALEWWTWDPNNKLLLDVAGSYERPNYAQTVEDLEAAGKAGAAGIVFVHGLPRKQVERIHVPYEGLQWKLPAIYVGADEGARLEGLAREGGSARITLRAAVKRVQTRMLLFTLPGLSDEKIVVQSHTDGMNAVWDNGPVAMVEMAEWFARIGRGCRPRTLMFAFTTGHLYQHLVDPDRDGSAEQLAKRLDREYDQGKVALVLPIEHMGAKTWLPVERKDGGPGRVLEPTGRNEANSIFIGESPALVESARLATIKHDVPESIALRGADLPGLQLPPHDSFGGEGIPYLHHMLPVVALVTGPWTLFQPGFTIEQLVDRELMHKQTLMFTDLVHMTSTIPRELLGGGYLAYREARRRTCGTALEALSLVRRCNGPAAGL